MQRRHVKRSKTTFIQGREGAAVAREDEVETVLFKNNER
jgi:hypothetical protein